MYQLCGWLSETTDSSSFSEHIPRGADTNPEVPIGSEDYETTDEEERRSDEPTNQEPVIPDAVGADRSPDQELDDKELKPMTPKATQHDEVWSKLILLQTIL